ncbi:hypothetical protein ASPCADRAFT_205388 [Aspergillus carbonarius ITEM 5010]|uniref:Uncharacterized protein n=1 Tax=Aspergillus carbonarius (strain ITEM 5010) TaxID=602072 RepID=A0A1R3RUG8_ASPC5|nr:hypothetical protein ASPCADRAFT_205388 [Aspergillus carbonarius ITEM 5010]
MLVFNLCRIIIVPLGADKETEVATYRYLVCLSHYTRPSDAIGKNASMNFTVQNDLIFIVTGHQLLLSPVSIEPKGCWKRIAILDNISVGEVF